MSDFSAAFPPVAETSKAFAERRCRTRRGFRLYISNMHQLNCVDFAFLPSSLQQACEKDAGTDHKKVFTRNIRWETTLKISILKAGTMLRFKHESFEGQKTEEPERHFEDGEKPEKRV